MSNVVMAAVVLSANVMGAGMAYPQAHRLVRTRRLQGLSSTWVGVSVSMNAWWLAYGLAVGVWALVPVSIVSLVLYGAIAHVLLSAGGRRMLPGFVLGALALGGLPAVALLAGGWQLAGVVIGLGYGVQLAPAVLAAHRTRDLVGVAPGTWWLALAEAALWLVYGAHVADPALLVGGSAGVVLATLILTRLAVTGHRPVRHAWAVG